MTDLPQDTDRAATETDRLRRELEETRQRLRRAEARVEPLSKQVLRLRAEVSRRQQLQEALLEQPRYRLADRLAGLLAPLSPWRRSRPRRRATHPASTLGPTAAAANDGRVALVVALDLVPVALESLVWEVAEITANHDVRPIFVVSSASIEPLVKRRIEFESIPPRQPWSDQIGGDYDDFVHRRLASIIESSRPRVVVSTTEATDVDLIRITLTSLFTQT